MRGYHHRIAAVFLNHSAARQVRLDDTLLREYVGGRGVGAALLAEQDRGVEPLDPDSLFCLLTGPLTGSDFPLSNRLALVFRSPLTRTIASAMTGGYFAAELKKGGLDGILLDGRAPKPSYVFVEGTRVEIRDAGALWGKGAVETVSLLQAAHRDSHVLAIGPSGEAMSPIATVINDKGRASGVRHGVGAVLGSKRVKAVVVRRTGAAKSAPADRAAFDDLRRRAHALLLESPLLSSKTGTLALHGTAIAVEMLGQHEALPTMNYRFTRMAGHEEIGGIRMSQTILRERLTCTGCPVRCRREVGSDGPRAYTTEGPDYSQLSALGSNCLVRSLEALGYLNYLCYELGIDPIEMGNTLAMLAEATELGLTPNGLRWGDADRMIELIELTGRREGIGGVLALGASAAANRIGAPHLAMSVKGISIQNVDPRPEPAWGLLNATENSGGAAHVWTYGDLVYGLRHAGVAPLVGARSTPGETADAVRYRQDLVAVIDSLTSCAFGSYAFTVQDYAEALSLVTDEPVTAAGLLATGARIFTVERDYNLAHGFTVADDTLPARFTREPVPDGIHAGRVCSLEPLLDEYFAGRGWNGQRTAASEGTRHRSLEKAPRNGVAMGSR